MSPVGTTKQFERLVEERFGPVIGFFSLDESAQASYAGFEEWPNIVLPVRRMLLEWVNEDNTPQYCDSFRYYVHAYDIARVLHITGRLTESEAVSYATRERSIVEFDARDGEYTKFQ